MQSLKFVGERLCLDFVNTVGGWADTVIDDKLARYDDLVRWAKLAGVIPAEQARLLFARERRRQKDASDVLKRAIALRSAVHGIFRSVARRQAARVSDTKALERELAVARSHQRLKHQRGRFDWVWHDPRNALDSMLWRVSISAAELLTSPDLAHVRECGGENCGWMFLDNSRNRSRRWCEMRECGNRAKVRRFRQRNRDR